MYRLVVLELIEKYIAYNIAIRCRGSNGARDRVIKILVSQERVQGLRQNWQRNIIIKEKYCKEERYLLKCRTCKHCFSETRDTAFFCLHVSKGEVLRIQAMLPEKEVFVV